MYIHGCNNFKIRGLTFENSPMKHLAVGQTSGGEITELTIIAPGESPNTDGIYLQNCQHISISNSIIGTGTVYDDDPDAILILLIVD